MKLRYWIILFALLLGGLGLLMRFQAKAPSLSMDSEKHTEEKPSHDSPSGKQAHDDHKHGQDEEKDDHKDDHDDHKDDHGKEEGGHKEDGHDEHEESEEESVGGVGKGNAVTAADENDGIRLSPKAIETMGIKTAPYSKGQIPTSALVRYQDNIGVYRLRNDWFKLLPIKIKGQQGNNLTILAADLEPNDQIVIERTGLMRAAELDAFSGEASHGH
ncbi:MAG: hypothetical protein F9K48_05045 [Candidatus Brocadia sp.]|nr:MAG: hypothetical protein F9K48_05045 [Candidatus Brocadia sp.]